MSIVIFAIWGNLDKIIKLVNNGASVNEKINGDTAIMMASRHGHFEIVKYLVQHNCLINEKNMHWCPALIEACINGHFKIVKYLIRNNANIDMAFVEAFFYKRFKIVKYLIKHGARIKVYNPHTEIIYYDKNKKNNTVYYLHKIIFKRLHII